MRSPPHTQDFQVSGPDQASVTRQRPPCFRVSSQQTAHPVSLTEATQGAPKTGEALLHPRGKAVLRCRVLTCRLGERGAGRSPVEGGAGVGEPRQQVHPPDSRAASPAGRRAGPKRAAGTRPREGQATTSSETAVASPRAGLSGTQASGCRGGGPSRAQRSGRGLPEAPGAAEPEAAARAPEGRAGRSRHSRGGPCGWPAPRDVGAQPAGVPAVRARVLAPAPVLPRTRLPFSPRLGSSPHSSCLCP